MTCLISLQWTMSRWAVLILLLLSGAFFIWQLNHNLPKLAFLLPSSGLKRYESVMIDSTDINNASSWLLVLVPSKMTNFQARQFMRDTFRRFWPGIFKATMVFFVGRRSLPPRTEPISATEWIATQRQLSTEAREKKDIVQTDCADTYEHLTCKMLAMMTWASQLKTKKNLQISWMIKADDDIAINAELLREKLEVMEEIGAEDQIYCHIRWFPAPNRKPGSKWKVSFERWPWPKYPTYCHGPCYLMTPMIASKLLENHRNYGWGQFKRFEDLYLTGILGSDLGIRLQEFNPGWFSSYSPDIPAILAHKQPLTETKTWRRFWES